MYDSDAHDYEYKRRKPHPVIAKPYHFSTYMRFIPNGRIKGAISAGFLQSEAAAPLTKIGAPPKDQREIDKSTTCALDLDMLSKQLDRALLTG